jgi:hypothetical protein
MADRDPTSDRRPLKRPDPDRILQGEEAAEREKQQARNDVTKGDRMPARPDDERTDEAADRAAKTRPSIIP